MVVGQFRHRARRLHPRRCRQLQRQAQRRQPGRQPRRYRQQQQLELRRRRPDRTIRKSIRLRLKQRRNLMATLLLSQGVPMLVAGDEFGRSQGGNNNAYCQDNEISWIDWEGIRKQDEAFRDFVRRLIKLRRDHIVFRRATILLSRATSRARKSRTSAGCGRMGRSSRRKTGATATSTTSACLVRGEAGEYHLTAKGEPQPDDSFFVILNAHFENIDWTLPSMSAGDRWRLADRYRHATTTLSARSTRTAAPTPRRRVRWSFFVRHQDTVEEASTASSHERPRSTTCRSAPSWSTAASASGCGRRTRAT